MVVEMATAEDDAGVRRLLRDNPMEGEIRLSFEREPSALLAARVEGDPHHTVVARATDSGAVVGMGSRAVWNVFVDGEPRRLGYLAQLRIDRRIRGRAQLLATGYRLLHERRGADELPFDLTSIVADNRVARRLLEAEVPGLPHYRELGGLSTLVVPARRARRAPVRDGRGAGGVRIEHGSADRMAEVATLLERNRRRYQLAPYFTAGELLSQERSRGLVPEDFRLAVAGEAVVGCLAVWDQRSFKQVVARGYAPRLARWRPWLNRLARWLGRPRLPAPGEPLALAYVSHLAVDGDDGTILGALMEAAHAEAGARGLDYLVLGLAARHPWLPWLRRRFRPREYASVLYTVHWGDGEGGRGTKPPLDPGLLPHVEAALL